MQHDNVYQTQLYTNYLRLTFDRWTAAHFKVTNLQKIRFSAKIELPTYFICRLDASL